MARLESESRSVLSNSYPMDYTVHGILQTRILEWVAFPFSRGSSQPRDQIQVSRIAGRFFISWATREAQKAWWMGEKYKNNYGDRLLIVEAGDVYTRRQRILSSFSGPFSLRDHHSDFTERTISINV